MNTPINPRLYESLVREFHSVRVANAGQAYVVGTSSGSRVDSPFRSTGRSGEYYCVNCPHCGDTRYRLWVNHMFGVDDGSGNNHFHMVSCFNEKCFRDHQDSRNLWNRLFPFNYSERIRIEQLERGTVGDEPLPVELAFNEMPDQAGWGTPEAQVGIDYLHHRGFDIQELYEYWGVYIASSFDRSSPPVGGRIVVPIRQRVASLFGADTFPLVGWQARIVGQGTSKYLCMRGLKKSKVLYGVDRASSSGPLVVVEGPTDVWRFGRDAVALLGKSASRYQVEQLVTEYQHRPIAIALDTDAGREAEDLARELRGKRGDWGCRLPVFVVPPPAGVCDFADCSRDEAWRQVGLYADAAGGQRTAGGSNRSTVQQELII